VTGVSLDSIEWPASRRLVSIMSNANTLAVMKEIVTDVQLM